MAVSPTLQQWRLRWQVARHQRLPGGRVLAGHHHDNVVVPLREPLASLVRANAGDVVTIRTPRRTLEVVLRAWHEEAAVVEAVLTHLPDLPRPLRPSHRARSALGGATRSAVYTYVEGTTLADTEPEGAPVGEGTMRRIAGIFGQLAAVPRDRLPPLPSSQAWPEDGDSAGFLTRLAHHAETRVHQPNRGLFGPLLDDLGVPRDAVQRFENLAKSLTTRPFGLLHTDIHRSNLVVRPGGELCLVDWELALYGDPLHDLATHLVRMRYTAEERLRMTALWRAEMVSRGLGARLEGMGDPARDVGDLARYLDFECAQSVHADTMRAALALPWAPTDADYATASATVRGALLKARRSLDLVHVPTSARAEEALRAWYARYRPLAHRYGRTRDAVRRPALPR